ncbi:MAG: hypothetical protein B7Z55_06920, partial [Planctomycetales bacterium 12-60-4]
MFRACATGLILLACHAWLGAAEPDLQLTLPTAAYAVVGAEMGVYFDNVVLSESSGDFRFDVECAVGKVETQRWTVTPAPGDIGDHPWRLRVFSGEKLLAEQSLVLHVVPATAGSGQTLRLLIVGDSLTHASVTANDLAQRLSQPDQPQTTFLGTHHPPGA